MIFKRLKFNKPIFAYLTLIGGFLIQITLGSIYTFGNMAPYFLDYMNNSNKYTAGKINPAMLTWIFGFAIFSFGVSMSFGGFLIPRFGVIVTVIIGCVLFNLGVFLTYLTIDSYLSFVVITYGCIFGLGIGTAYGALLSIPTQWFPKNKGLMTGIIIAGFGFSGSTIDFVQLYLINGNLTTGNIPTDMGLVKRSFLYMGFIYTCCQILGVLLIRLPKIECGKQNNNVELWPICNDIQSINRKPLEMLFQWNFWIMWLTYLLNSYFIVIVISLHKLYGKALSQPEHKVPLCLTVTSACGALFNGIGRIIWGYLIDKVSYKKLMSILTLLMSLTIGTFCLMENMPKHSKTTLYFIWVIALHFLSSASFSIYPVICSQNFGMKYSVINYAILFTAYSLSGIATSVAITPIFNNAVTLLMYRKAFLVGCGLSFLTFLINLMYKEKPLILQSMERSI